jgi:hypothetical protein
LRHGRSEAPRADHHPWLEHEDILACHAFARWRKAVTMSRPTRSILTVVSVVVGCALSLLACVGPIVQSATGGSAAEFNRQMPLCAIPAVVGIVIAIGLWVRREWLG